MICDKCKENMNQDDVRVIHGRNLCEDCYMDALSPAKTCDPWASYSAKFFSDDYKSGTGVTETQAGILKFLKECGGAEPETIISSLKMKRSDFEREVAALRHMEKIRGELREGRKYFRLW